MSEKVYTFTVDEENTGARVDKALASAVEDLSRSALQKLFDEGKISVNHVVVSKNYKLRAGDCVVISVPEPRVLETKPENIPLDIVYEDQDLLVVNKPKGMVVHPAAGNYDKTLVNALLHHCGDSLSGINGVIRPGIVHRIDKDTSGLLIVAKNDRSHKALAEQIKVHSFLREYEAVVLGNITEDSGTISEPIGRSKKDRKKMCVTYENSKAAITHYRVIKRFQGFTHIRCRLETGRTHQIRVHMAYIGHPLAGDRVYGPKKYIEKLDGQCLHAKTIGFVHPTTQQEMFFESALPVYFTDFLKTLNSVYGEDNED